MGQPWRPSVLLPNFHKPLPSRLAHHLSFESAVPRTLGFGRLRQLSCSPALECFLILLTSSSQSCRGVWTSFKRSSSTKLINYLPPKLLLGPAPLHAPPLRSPSPPTLKTNPPTLPFPPPLLFSPLHLPPPSQSPPFKPGWSRTPPRRLPPCPL